MPNSSNGRLLGPGALIVYFTAIMIGSLHAQVFPTLSVYLVDLFAATPFYVGFFFVAVAASSMVVSQWVGVLSDRGANRKFLISAGMVAGALACLCFAYSPSYWIAFVSAVGVFSLAFITLPQIMALGREFAVTKLGMQQVPMFNSILRASFAFSWVASPPVGFYLQHKLGPANHYLLLTGLYVAVGFIAWFALPNVKHLDDLEPHDDHKPGHIPANVKLGFVACALLFGLNHSYMIAMPQLLTQHLNVESFYAGHVIGLAAASEIPIMILGGWLATRVPLVYLIRLSSIAAILLYLGVWQSTALWHLYALQVLNALFIGFMASLGMTWFQDQMPRFPGTASSLFTNTINAGNIIGSVLVGVFAAWVSYRFLYFVNAVVGVLAAILLWFCR